MTEYEISNGDKKLGIVKIFNKFYTKSLIKVGKNNKYRFNTNNKQTYIIKIFVKNQDDLYQKVSLYKKDNIFDSIDSIKKMNNLKHIKNNEVKIVVLEKYLNMFNKSKDNINLESYIDSMIFFIKSVLNKNNLDINIDDIYNSFNNFINSNEYDFVTDDERKEKFLEYIDKLKKFIAIIENKSNYRYGIDFIKPIIIDN